MKIVTVVGARPQFIKEAVVSQELRKNHKEILVHTGQHFDYNMSQQFFEELSIPNPDYNLGISGGTHAEMTGKMMMAIEKVLLNEKPDGLLIFGDTNSTLAAALSASKLHVPICHVEAGARTWSATNPEEINRVCVDHISSLLLTSTESGIENLKKEGLYDKSSFVGDPMYDAFIKYSQISPKNKTLNLLSGEVISIPEEYLYLTCHREENTGNDDCLIEVLSAMECLNCKVIYPVHPRNKERALRIKNEYGFSNTILTEPVGYIESIYLVNNAQKVVTDSGGLQREAFFAKKKCVTLLDFVCWPETMVDNRNNLARPEKSSILNELEKEQKIDIDYCPFGDGKASKKIVSEIERVFDR